MKKFIDTLVLNRNMVAIHIVDYKKTMSLLWQESARAMDRDYALYPSFKDWLEFTRNNEREYPLVHTVNYPIAIPEIIVLSVFDRLPTRDIKYSRQTLFSRDNHTCAYCGGVFHKDSLTVDHILPRAKGGMTTWENTITACKPCNSKKGDKTLQEASLKLLFKPKKPKWLSPIGNVSKEHPCKSWKLFLNKPLIDLGV